MQVRFSKRFVKQYDKAGEKIKRSFDKRLKIFIEDPYNSSLNNHQLTGSFSGYRSINITGDWRAIYSVSKSKDGGIVIVFEMLGIHSQLFR